jgi:hypothetical protein
MYTYPFFSCDIFTDLLLPHTHGPISGTRDEDGSWEEPSDTLYFVLMAPEAVFDFSVGCGESDPVVCTVSDNDLCICVYVYEYIKSGSIYLFS